MLWQMHVSTNKNRRECSNRTGRRNDIGQSRTSRSANAVFCRSSAGHQHIVVMLRALKLQIRSVA